MTRNTLIEAVVAGVFLLTTMLILNPFTFWMPDMAHTVVLGCLLAAFGALSTLVLREQAGDEREDAHRKLSGRAAFLAGSLVLVLAIAVQGSRGYVDPWLVVALLAMTFTKLAVRLYSDLKQ